MIKELRRKFICINMTIVTAMLLVIFGMVLYFTQENLEEQSLHMLKTVSETRNNPFAPPTEKQVQLPYFYVSITAGGEFTGVYSGYLDMMDSERMEAAIAQAIQEEEQTGILKEYRLRYQKKTTLTGQSIAFVDISSEIATMENLIKTCLAIGLVSFAAFLGLSLWLARWAVKPVEQAWNQQRQFVADASHELKTPLTVILTNGELLQSPEYDEAARKNFTDSIMTMAQQMRGLVESLLELARVDNGAVKMVFETVDLSELTEDGLLPFEPVYFERELELESGIEPGILVKGSRSHLKQVLDILLDNAAKYASSPGRVMVRLGRQGGSCLLSVSSPGEAISKEDLKNIFKRFYRVDQARSMNHSYGLGLSIAESIVKEHSGRIWAESADGWNTFFVQLPMASGRL